MTKQRSLNQGALIAVLSLLLLFLNGCTEYVPVDRVNNAMNKCESNGGVDRIEVKSHYFAEYAISRVFCSDGAEFATDASEINQ